MASFYLDLFDLGIEAQSMLDGFFVKGFKSIGIILKKFGNLTVIPILYKLSEAALDVVEEADADNTVEVHTTIISGVEFEFRVGLRDLA